MDPTNDAPARPSPISPRADAVLTAIGFAVLAVASLVALVWSGFFAMATDACGTGCDETPVINGIRTVHLGLAVTWVLVLAGVVVSSAKDLVKAPWPWLALLVVVVVFAVGAGMAQSAAA